MSNRKIRFDKKRGANEREGAGILSSMVFADGFVELSEDIVNVEKGDFVNYIPFSELGL